MSPTSGAREVWLPRCPLHEGSAEMMRAGAGGCLLVQGPHCRLVLNTQDLPGDQRTPWFPLQNVALP